MNIAIKKVKVIVDNLIKEYNLNNSIIRLVGGGGSASIITPYLGEMMDMKFNIAKNAPYISTIGVALALVREQVERNVANPTENDIRRIRADVMEAVTKAGANPSTVEISIEVDSQKKYLNSVATGATELRTKDLNTAKKTDEELKEIAVTATGVQCEEIELVAKTGRWNAFIANKIEKKLFGLVKKKKYLVRVIDNEGVIRLQKDNGKDIDGN